ncbi:hypothetical protein HDV03_003682 [Kappamyces sp. JEL0829]|nr:hypothetical protein HDV03_003682 [Kappamyces sp. JEL0829]
MDREEEDEEVLETIQATGPAVSYPAPEANSTELTPQQQAAQAAKEEQLRCRMYENLYPEQDTCVMVNIRQITDVGTYVTLLEYDNIEGMILLSELTRRRVRSINKLVRIGKNEVAVVLRVDKEKGYIDLSKRRASGEEIQACEDRFIKSKAVHSIMRHVALVLNMKLEDLYTLYGWPLYRKFGHAYEAFKIAIADPDGIFDPLDMPERIKSELVSNIRKRLTPQPVKIRADIDCSCFGYEGVDAVKAALLAGEACSTEDVPIKIQLIAPPLYVLNSTCTDKNLGISIMEKAIQKIEEVVTSYTGTVAVKMKPRVISQSDEADLAQLMSKMEMENREVAADDDDDDAPVAPPADQDDGDMEDDE